MRRLLDVEQGRVVTKTDLPALVHVYVNPDEGERRDLVENRQIDEHTLASALDPDELSRLEFEPDHVALIFKRPRTTSLASTEEGAPEFAVASVGAFLFEDHLDIVQSEDLPLYEGRRQNPNLNTPSGMLLRLLGRTIAHFLEHLRAINSMANDIEDQLNTSLENRYLIALFNLSKSLVYYVNAINANDALLHRLKNNAAKIGFTPDEIEVLDDVLIENQQCALQARIYADITSSMMDARASIVSNNLNVLMKTLNIITIGLMVPTMVVSIFSMNVKMPWGLGLDEPVINVYAFWIVLALSAAALAGFLAFWRYKKW